jgi:hypothetical protein
MITRILLVLMYPLVLLARAVNGVFKWDRLHLREGKTEQSCWIVRRERPDILRYFSEQSSSEGAPGWSAARPILALLWALSRLYRPRRTMRGGTYELSAEREQGIPDEVYTLW